MERAVGSMKLIFIQYVANQQFFLDVVLAEWAKGCWRTRPGKALSSVRAEPPGRKRPCKRWTFLLPFLLSFYPLESAI